MSARKPAARIAKPVARYRPGQVPVGAHVAESESSEEEEEALEEGDEVIGAMGEEEEEDRVVQKGKGKMTVELRDVQITDGRVRVGGQEEEEEESEEESEEEEPAKPVFRQPGKAAPAPAAEEELSEYETDSEEEESEEEARPAPRFKPVFVPKRARDTAVSADAAAKEAEEAEKRRAAKEEERKKASVDMVANSIKRELLEKEAAEAVPDVDDTDGADPQAEFDAWRLRELGRIQRDKEAQIARDEELEEIERRRALPEAQRLAEDLEHAKKTREKPKGQQKFLQKYWHKGAFHQDMDILKKRDYTEATESTVDVSMLPKVMQVRNFGKRSRTKYTHLAAEDTTFQDRKPRAVADKPGPSRAADAPTDDPRFMPDASAGRDGPRPGTGANTSELGTRSWGGRRSPRPAPRDGPGRRDGFDRDDYPPRRSPPRRRDYSPPPPARRYDDGGRYDDRDRDRDRYRSSRYDDRDRDRDRDRLRRYDDRDRDWRSPPPRSRWDERDRERPPKRRDEDEDGDAGKRRRID